MSKPQLLIVDDEPDMARFLSDVAEGMGFDVKIATSAKAFQEIYNATTPAGILMDIVMPVMDGNELLEWLALQNKTTPVILMSGYDGEYIQTTATLAQARGAIIIAGLAKPIQLNDLKPLLKDIYNSVGRIEVSIEK
jgi:CheY-like chemotaxis protein